LARAFRNPAFTLSWISARSNSASVDDLEHQPSCRCRQVQVIAQADEGDAQRLELRQRVDQMLQAAGEAVQLPHLAGINWHWFRHSFTVLQRRQGTHPKVASELLGHASVATAMDAYDHSSDSELRQPLDQLLRDVMKSEVAA
jgi:site-specific recombinase XerD